MKNLFYDIHELMDIGIKLSPNPKNIFISKEVKFYNIKNIEISNNVRIDDFCILIGNIKIGSFVHIGAFSMLSGSEESIEVCDFAGISQRVSVYSASDDYSGKSLTNPMIPAKFKNITSNKIIFKKHSICGSGSVILPNSGGLEEGVSLGAMSLLTKKTEPWSIYFGIPAKKLKNRSKEMLVLEKDFINSISKRGGGSAKINFLTLDYNEIFMS